MRMAKVDMLGRGDACATNLGIETVLGGTNAMIRQKPSSNSYLL